jgi:hypothetical protein
VAGIRVEVGTHSVLRVDRLADVNNRSGGVFHDGIAGFGREGIENTLKVSRDFHWDDFNPKRPPSRPSPKFQVREFRGRGNNWMDSNSRFLIFRCFRLPQIPCFWNLGEAGGG